MRWAILILLAVLGGCDDDGRPGGVVLMEPDPECLDDETISACVDSCFVEACETYGECLDRCAEDWPNCQVNDGCWDQSKCNDACLCDTAQCPIDCEVGCSGDAMCTLSEPAC